MVFARFIFVIMAAPGLAVGIGAALAGDWLIAFSGLLLALVGGSCLLATSD